MDDMMLVQSAQKGNERAFAALVRRNERRLYSTAYSILGSSWDASDACQDAFLEAWAKIGTLRDPSSFRPWMARIVVNKCRAAHRKTRRLVVVEEVPEREAHEFIGPESAIDLADAVRSLDEDHRMVIALRYFSDLKVEDIAGILGVPAGTVKSRINRALRRLKESLGAESTEVQQ
ncbi:MAG: RNA polymerase sigma factor [Coriobacteriia bacterium]|nr:RNA polymerase sigma factor [Coriobacteriia bacterium]